MFLQLLDMRNVVFLVIFVVKTCNKLIKQLCMYPGWVLLQRGQVALQRQAAAVVEQSLHPGHVGLHQLLPLAGCLLLQSLHLLLETLHKMQHIVDKKEHG